ncbi:MAG: DUF4179 domain-containing protein [Eubacterium sp.]|nr:DUF4179 domain-containing protein [Eubacterium sp.]
MKDKIDILKSEVEISDVVMSATKETFAKILEEGKQKENEKIQAMPAVRKRNGFKKRWIALVAVAALAVGVLSVGAGTNFNWFAPVEDEMFISESQKEALEKYGLGTTLQDAVTQNGVTVSVEQVICDSNYYFVVLGIEGVEYPTGDQWLSFEEWDIDIVGGDIHRGTYGQYLGVDEETGKMLYLWEGDMKNIDIVGKTMRVNMKDVQISRWFTEEEMAEKAEGSAPTEIINEVEGEWYFEFVLNGGSQELAYELSGPTGNPDITLDSVVITPLSIKMSSTHADPEQMLADWDDPEDGGDYYVGYYGFLMSDGTIIQASAGSGSGTFNKSRTGRDEFYGFGTIVDLYEIDSILFIEEGDAWDVYNKENPTVEDFVVVPLP